MSDFNRNVAARGGFADRAAIDVGLRAYMLRVYNYMAAAVALTGVVAWLCFQAAGGDAIQVAGGTISGVTPFGQLMLGGYTPIILMLGTLGLVFFISFRINTLQYTTALALFMLYAALLGAALSSIFVAYTGGVDHAGVLHLGGVVRRAQPLWLHHPARPLGRSARS